MTPFDALNGPRVIYRCDVFRIVRRKRSDVNVKDIFDVEYRHFDAMGQEAWHQAECISTEFSGRVTTETVLHRLLTKISDDTLRIVRGTLVDQYSPEVGRESKF